MKITFSFVLVFLLVGAIPLHAERHHHMAGLQFKTLEGWAPTVEGPTLTIQKDSKDALVMVNRLPFPKKGVALFKIKKHLEKTGKRFLVRAVESELNLQFFDRDPFKGYYFQLTDQTDKPGEYKNMVQGVIKGDHLLIGFTLLFHDSEKPTEDVFEMLSSFVPTKNIPI